MTAEGRLEPIELGLSGVFPGTPHGCRVYVPAGYRPAIPAPVMIFPDGDLFAGRMNAPAVLDELIARGEIPVMLGIFVDPGIVPVDSEESQRGVWNRTYEYDSISPRFARFLVDEVIPRVEQSYTVSRDPNDRGLAGISTSAVAAFRAAWERPDQFRRVATFIGTFVDIMGANVMPVWVRKTDPKPLRVFQEDTTDDMVLLYGDWAEANRVMAAALDRAHYDHRLVIGPGIHAVEHPAATLPEALRWLWRDYPRPIVAPTTGPIFESLEPQMAANGRPLLYADRVWEQAGGTYASVVTPTGDRDGVVFFADPVGERIYRATPAGAVEVFAERTGGARALKFAPNGRLYAAQPARRRVVSFGPSGDEQTVAEDIDAHDLVLTAAGVAYATDAARKAIVRIGTDGAVTTVYASGELGTPSALALSADQAFVYVLDATSKFGWAFKIAPDGALIHGVPRFRLEWSEQDRWGNVESVAVDSLGTLYAACDLGIALSDSGGRNQEILNTPEWGSVTSVAFGGPDHGWLYTAQNNKLFRRKIRRTGVAAWTPVKPPPIRY